jgi:hypothetical protein
MRRIPPLALFAILIVLIAVLSALGPREASLGANVRLVYLHGAWVWTALVAFAAAAAAGLVGLALRRHSMQDWSIALGQAGTFFWVTYLPLSLWTMQTNWNGLFLDEPRWRVGVNFAVIAVLLQAAILILQRPGWGSGVSLAFFAALAWSVAGADQVMHPPSPIAASGSLSIRAFFLGLLVVCLLACWLLTRSMLGHWIRRRADPT